MIRNILRSRRVNKARKRIVALIPADSGTISGITLTKGSYSEVAEETHSYSWDLPVSSSEHNILAVDGRGEVGLTGELSSQVEPYSYGLKSIAYPSLAKNGYPSRNRSFPEFSLAYVIHLLVKSLDPESIIVLDAVLRSTLLSNDDSCNNCKHSCAETYRHLKHEPGDSRCILLSSIYRLAFNVFMVLVKKLDTLTPLSTSIFISLTQNNFMCTKRSASSPSGDLSAKFESGKGLTKWKSGSTCASPHRLRSADIPDTPHSKNVTSGDSQSVVCVDPLLAVCKAWRWPDLEPGDWLRRLDICESARNRSSDVLCINPHHWSRVITPVTRLPLSSASETGNHQRVAVAQDFRFYEDPNLVCVGISTTERLPRTSTPERLPKTANSGSSPSPQSSDHTDVTSERLDDTPLLACSNKTVCSSAFAENTPTLFPQRPSKSQERTAERVFQSCTGLAKFNQPLSSYDEQPSVRENSTRDAKWNVCSSSCGQLCSTDSTEITSSSSDNGRKQPHRTYYKRFEEAGHHSSTSTSGNEEYAARSRAKKLRPLSPSECKPPSVIHSPPAKVNTRKHRSNVSWANLSYWEATKHIGHGWFKLIDPVVRVVYDSHPDIRLAENFPNEQSASKTNESSANPPRYSSNCIRLSKLITRRKHASPSVVSHSEQMQSLDSQNPSSLITCLICGNVLPCSDTTQLNSVKSPELRFPSTSVWPPTPEHNCSWRQCHRLGTQGISFTLTSSGHVWIDNQTANLPIFVSSACFIHNSSSPSASPGLPVYRVPAGSSILVFDLLVYYTQNNITFSQGSVHFQDNNIIQNQNENKRVPSSPFLNLSLRFPVVHISLGKGWGPSYRRPDVTHCPARLELWINIEQIPFILSRWL